eukprot:4349979-Amphidinium_carterae.2
MAQKKSALDLFHRTAPVFLIGSPECTAFSSLLNFGTEKTVTYQNFVQKGLDHINQCMDMYERQLWEGSTNVEGGHGSDGKRLAPPSNNWIKTGEIKEINYIEVEAGYGTAHMQDQVEEYRYWDERSGAELPTPLVKQAILVEIKFLRDMTVYKKVPATQAIEQESIKTE